MFETQNDKPLWKLVALFEMMLKYILYVEYILDNSIEKNESLLILRLWLYDDPTQTINRTPVSKSIEGRNTEVANNKKANESP